MSVLDDYTRNSGFTPTPATRRLIAKVLREASTPANKGELGAWQFTFARISVMTEAELTERGCPREQVEPLLGFATQQTVVIVAPIVAVLGKRGQAIDPETGRQTANTSPASRG